MKRLAVALMALSLVAGCGTSPSAGGSDSESEADELRQRLEDLEAEVADAEADRRAEERCDAVRAEYEARRGSTDMNDPYDKHLARQHGVCDALHP